MTIYYKIQVLLNTNHIRSINILIHEENSFLIYPWFSAY
jgi:hypothetical protein